MYKNKLQKNARNHPRIEKMSVQIKSAHQAFALILLANI